MKSAMSLPAQNAPGAPANITQWMASDKSASRSALVMAPYIATVSAFFFSGRLMRTVRTAPSSVTATGSVMTFPLCRPLNQSGITAVASISTLAPSSTRAEISTAVIAG